MCSKVYNSQKGCTDAYEKSLARGEDGCYEDEELFHNILFPKKKTSDEINIDECNLWILDIG